MLVNGLLGVSHTEEVFSSQHLMNIVATVYSIAARLTNRQAIGFALQQTTAVRDGGSREDTIKPLPNLVHPRTSQKYDKSVLASGWNENLKKCLQAELEHFKAEEELARKIQELLASENTDLDRIAELKNEYNKLLSNAPPQIQLVWDNLNMSTKHRFKRCDDDIAALTLDWMASLWVKDRVNVNHMEHQGVPLKSAEELTIEDMVPIQAEKDYIFRCLVSYFSHSLLDRYPLLFKSLKPGIRQNRPHQFQQAMDKKSEEYTGNIFTKSECKTEDLVSMLAEIQKYVHTTDDTEKKCFEKKIIRNSPLYCTEIFKVLPT